MGFAFLKDHSGGRGQNVLMVRLEGGVRRLLQWSFYLFKYSFLSIAHKSKWRGMEMLEDVKEGEGKGRDSG